MKIVAFSDSHGNRSHMQEAVSQALRGAPIDVCVHCGDGARDMDAVEALLRQANPGVQIYAVRGNCDIGAFDLPYLECFEANGVRMIATHGHLYGVKTGYESLADAAASQGAKAAFFGHTHSPLLEAVRGVYLINPGSVAVRGPGNIAYAQVIVEANGKLRADLIPWTV